MGRIVLTLWLVFAACVAGAEPRLQLTANLEWDRKDAWFGGFSGLEVDPTGDTATLITDKGRLLRVNMIRQGARLTSLQIQSRIRLRHPSGRVLSGIRADAEGLAIGPRGETFISFEHDHRVARLVSSNGVTQPLALPPGVGSFEQNAGLEALAVAPNGSLFALPEKSGARRAPFPLYQYFDDQWRIVARIKRKGPFLPVGADFDANGLLYLLERAATPVGFRSRIRRFELRTQPISEQTLLTTVPSKFDNLEGISLWQDASGTTRITLISDDNFLAIQRTQIVEFALIE